MTDSFQDSEKDFSGCLLLVKYSFDLKWLSQKFPFFLPSNCKNLRCQKRKTDFLGFEDSLIGSKFLLKWLKISDNFFFTEYSPTFKGQ